MTKGKKSTKPPRSSKKSAKGKSIVIEMYPDVPKPRWVKLGAPCEVLGEGMGNYFKIVEIHEGSSSVALVALRQVGDDWVDGHGHGRESFTKLRRVILPKPRPSFEEWLKECAAVAKEILGLTDILDPDDPYELRDLMRDAYDRRETPRALIEGAFEEDLARADYDEQLAAEALEHEEE